MSLVGHTVVAATDDIGDAWNGKDALIGTVNDFCDAATSAVGCSFLTVHGTIEIGSTLNAANGQLAGMDVGGGAGNVHVATDVFQFQVSAVNANGEGPLSAVITVSNSDLPDVPPSLSLSSSSATSVEEKFGKYFGCLARCEEQICI